MKVRELVQELSKLDQDLDVLCWTEDDKLVGEGNGFKLLEIEDVSTVPGEYAKNGDGTRGFKIGGTSSKIAAINVTADF